RGQGIGHFSPAPPTVRAKVVLALPVCLRCLAEGLPALKKMDIVRHLKWSADFSIPNSSYSPGEPGRRDVCGRELWAEILPPALGLVGELLRVTSPRRMIAGEKDVERLLDVEERPADEGGDLGQKPIIDHSAEGRSRGPLRQLFFKRAADLDG